MGFVKVQTALYNILEKHKESNSIVIKAQLLQSTKQQNQFKYMIPQSVFEMPFWNSWYHQVFVFLRAVHSTILLRGFWLMRVPALSNPQVHVICAGHVSFCHVGFCVFGNILWTWPMECGINIEKQNSANWSYKHLLLEGCQVPYVIGLCYEKDSCRIKFLTTCLIQSEVFYSTWHLMIHIFQFRNWKILADAWLHFATTTSQHSGVHPQLHNNGDRRNRDNCSIYHKLYLSGIIGMVCYTMI